MTQTPTEENAENATLEPSPLAEAQADSLNELFSRLDRAVASRSLQTPGAKKDIESVVAVLRAERERWLQAEAAGAKKLTKHKKASETTCEDIGL